MTSNKVLGVDVGGTHITAAVIDLANKAMIETSVCRKDVNAHGTADEILSSWTSAMIESINTSSEKITQVGFAMPGPFDYENGICLIKGFDKYEALYEMDIKEYMSVTLNIAPEHIMFHNDAACFLAGEVLTGAAKRNQHAIGITLGTGLGSASSRNGITKDAALSVLTYKEEKIEEFVSTRGLLRTYKELTGKTITDVKTLAEQYHTDAGAAATFKLFAERLAWFLCRFTEEENNVPDVLVIGGNIALCWDLFMPHTLAELKRNNIHIPRILQATNGEYAALIGAVSPFVQINSSEISLAL